VSDIKKAGSPWDVWRRETEDEVVFCSYTEVSCVFCRKILMGDYSDHYSHSEILCLSNRVMRSRI
ncbi:MAG: hypothetical protein ACLUD0_07955, partial [Eubacterium ramulus]